MLNIKHFIESLTFKGLVLVSVPIVFQLTFVFLLLHLVNEAETTYLRERQPYEVASQAMQLPTLAVTASVTLMTWKHTNDSSNEKEFETLCAHMTKAIDRLKNTEVSDVAKEKKDQILYVSDGLLKRLKSFRDQIRVSEASGTPLSGNTFKADLKVLTNRLFADVDVLTKRETSMSDLAAKDKIAARARVEMILVIGVLISFLTSCAMAAYFTLGISRRINRMVKNTSLLAQTEPLLSQDTSPDEIGELDRMFHEMAESLERATIEKRDFIHLMSEQLRKPLVESNETFLSFSRGAYGPITEKGQAILEKTQRTTRRLIGLVGELLDVEQIEAPSLVLDITETVLSKTVAQAVDSVQVLAERKGIKIESTATDVVMFADEERIVRVIVNLLANAIKFSSRDSAIHIEISNTESNVKIAVRDHGQGIPREKQTAVFEKFQQVDQLADTRAHKGTGLGLPICKMIVEAHGGTIGVESTEGEGSCFWFELPILPASTS